jgi:hypothetical protein
MSRLTIGKGKGFEKEVAKEYATPYPEMLVASERRLRTFRGEETVLQEQVNKQALWLAENARMVQVSGSWDVWNMRVNVHIDRNNQLDELREKIESELKFAWDIVDGLEDPVARDKAVHLIYQWEEPPFMWLIFFIIAMSGIGGAWV